MSKRRRPGPAASGRAALLGSAVGSLGPVRRRSGRPATRRAVVRSLGPPPLAIDPAVVERHLTAVYEEAVRAATALAAANGLLAADEEEDPD